PIRSSSIRTPPTWRPLGRSSRRTEPASPTRRSTTSATRGSAGTVSYRRTPSTATRASTIIEATAAPLARGDFHLRDALHVTSGTRVTRHFDSPARQFAALPFARGRPRCGGSGKRPATETRLGRARPGTEGLPEGEVHDLLLKVFDDAVLGCCRLVDVHGQGHASSGRRGWSTETVVRAFNMVRTRARQRSARVWARHARISRVRSRRVAGRGPHAVKE